MRKTWPYRLVVFDFGVATQVLMRPAAALSLPQQYPCLVGLHHLVDALFRLTLWVSRRCFVSNFLKSSEGHRENTERIFPAFSEAEAKQNLAPGPAFGLRRYVRGQRDG